MRNAIKITMFFMVAIMLTGLLLAQQGRNIVEYGVIHAWNLSTGADTSSVELTHSNMTYRFWVGDTTGDDSVDYTFYFDVCANQDTADWVCIDSLSLATDSTWTVFVLTEFAIPNDPFLRIRSVGGSANIKDSYAEIKAVKSEWYLR